MKNTSLETKLGMFVALVVVAAVLLLEMAGGTDFFKKGYRLHGLFTTAQELKIGDPVKMAGVPIGKVEQIGFDQGKVKVTMKLNQGVEVKTDAQATIRFLSTVARSRAVFRFRFSVMSGDRTGPSPSAWTAFARWRCARPRTSSPTATRSVARRKRMPTANEPTQRSRPSRLR